MAPRFITVEDENAREEEEEKEKEEEEETETKSSAHCSSLEERSNHLMTSDLPRLVLRRADSLRA